MGKDTQANLTKPLSERAAASLARTFAMQNRPAPGRKRQSLRGGWAGPTPAPPSSQTEERLGPGLPKRQTVPGNLWLAWAGNHMTVRGASWVQGGLGHASSSQPLKAQTPHGALNPGCRMSLPRAVCTALGGAKIEPQVFSRSPADGRPAPSHLTSSGPDLSITCANLPQTLPGNCSAPRDTCILTKWLDLDPQPPPLQTRRELSQSPTWTTS